MGDPTNAEKAKAAHGGGAPDWVIALADACDASNQKLVGKRIGYTGSVISQILANRYPGNLGLIEEKVRGAFMQAVVECPVLGVISRDRCLGEQVEPFRATSSMRAQLYHACRGGCPNFRAKDAHAFKETRP